MTHHDMTMTLADCDMRLIEGWQRGFPLLPRPYAAIGRALGMPEAEVIDRLHRLRTAGILARVGATVRPNAAGASTLAAISVAPERVEEIAAIVSAEPTVTHNYEREHAHLRAKLVEWGGNASGVNVANIDNLGNVHPDTFWWGCSVGNVRSRPFAAIWSDRSHPLMAGLKSRPRPVKGRCGACRFLAICGGNTRVRALRLTGDPWAEDRACYLTDAEIGVVPRERLAVTPFEGVRP